MNLEKRFIITIFLSLLILFILKAFLHSEKIIIVKLRQNVVVNKDNVYLKDIAIVIGNKKLNSLFITKSPSPSNSIYLNKNFIYQKIKTYLKNGKISIYGPENIKITRNYYLYPKEIIDKLCINFLKQHEKEIFKENKWDIIKIISPERIILPYKNVDVRVVFNENKIFNRIVLNLLFLKQNEEKILTKVNAIIFVKIYKKVLVAKFNIPYRKKLFPDMFEVKEVAVTNPNLHYVKSLKDIVGKISARFIKEGELLTEDMIKSPPLVRRGDLVQVIATDGKGIVISTIGKALDNGFLNNTIRIMNIKSGKVFIGEVRGEDKVIVRF